MIKIKFNKKLNTKYKEDINNLIKVTHNYILSFIIFQILKLYAHYYLLR